VLATERAPSVPPAPDGYEEPDRSEGKGHIHIQLDENPYSTIHTALNVFVFAGVKPGTHKVELELVHGDHTPLKAKVEKEVEFTVAEK